MTGGPRLPDRHPQQQGYLNLVRRTLATTLHGTMISLAVSARLQFAPADEGEER
jgi:hypothetical protein